MNTLMPGPFLTDISKAWDLEAFAETARRSIPLGRGGQPEEVVGAALYLASDAVLLHDGRDHQDRWRRGLGRSMIGGVTQRTEPGRSGREREPPARAAESGGSARAAESGGWCACRATT